jgi:WXXGXW repeat (2 copies)
MLSRHFGPLAACLIIAASCAGCAMDPIVHVAPPPDRVEVAGAAPGPGHVWVHGNWRWDGREYAWAPGHWEAGRGDSIWVHGHWRSVSDGWVWIDGRWAAR